MKRVFKIMLAVICAASLASCSLGEDRNLDSKPSVSRMEVTLESENGEPAESQAESQAEATEKDGIVLIVRHTNSAWGYHDSGIFADTDGGVYSFDFSADPNGDDPCDRSNAPKNEEEFIEKLNEIRADGKPEKTVKTEPLNECAELSEKADENAGFSKKEVAMDYGQGTLYAVSDERLIKISSYGDTRLKPKDDAAKKIERIAKNKLKLWDIPKDLR